MNKRQKKKRQKKYLPIISDEFNLLTMTTEERYKACEDYYRFREKYAYRKHHKDLKNSNPLYYAFPVGKEFHESLKVISTISRKKTQGFIVTQSLDDFKEDSL